VIERPPPAEQSSLSIFSRFIRFGFLAWGGPVAQIGMIKRELVDEERWLEPERFNRLLAIYQVLPGPEAHELCVHLGMLKGGRLGGILAGLGFMLPGLLLVLALAWAYQRLDLGSPFVAAALLGVQAGVIALIVRAVHRIADHALSDRWLWLTAVASAAAASAGISFWVILPAAGLAYVTLASGRFGAAILVAAAAGLLAWAIDGRSALPGAQVASGSAETVAVGTIGAAALFLSGLKAGLLTFGGAYTAIPFVRADAVGRGWVTDGQFLDGLAISGVIPAPLIIFATFVGYLAGGLGGALAMTAGMFMPAFAFTLLFYDRLERVVDDQRLHGLLAGVAAAVVGLIAVTTVQLGSNVAYSVSSLPIALGIFAGALALLYAWRSKLAVPLVILASACAGTLLLG
jgi:chromate transporter